MLSVSWCPRGCETGGVCNWGIKFQVASLRFVLRDVSCMSSSERRRTRLLSPPADAARAALVSGGWKAASALFRRRLLRFQISGPPPPLLPPGCVVYVWWGGIPTSGYYVIIPIQSHHSQRHAMARRTPAKTKVQSPKRWASSSSRARAQNDI